MNRGEIRDEIRRLIKDTDSNDPRWSDTVLNTRIDQSHEKIAALAKCIIERYTTNLVASTAEYTVPDYYLEDISVQVLNSDSQWVTLKKTTEKERDVKNPKWRDDDLDLPVFYYVRDNVIGLYPCPTTARTNGLRIDMYRRPDAMTADADIPFEETKEMYPYHESICFDVAANCKFDDGKFNQGFAYRAETQKIIRDIRSLYAGKNEGTRMPNIYEQVRESSRRSL